MALDELMSCGQLGLIQAAESYDARNNCSFPTYARTRIRGAILNSTSDWYRQALTHKPLHEADAICTPDKERKIDLRRAMGELTGRERRVLHLLYVQGWTMLEVSLELGVTESRICQMKSQAVEYLRDRMNVS